jgi:hypothetical protein
MQQFLQFIILTFIYTSTCFGRPHAHHQELNNCSSSLWFYLRSVVIAVLLVVIGPVGNSIGCHETLFSQLQVLLCCTLTVEPVVCLSVCLWRDSPQWTRASSFLMFLDHTQRRTTVGRTLLDE